MLCFQTAFSIIESNKQPTCNRPSIGQKRNDYERHLDFYCSSSVSAVFILSLQYARTPPVSHSEAKPASVPAAAGIRWAAFGAAFRPAQASLSAWRAKASASGTGLSAGCDCHHRRPCFQNGDGFLRAAGIVDASAADCPSLSLFGQS